MIAGFPFIASSLDADARAYCQTSGATDRAALNFFVKGIKRLGLWDDMVCWPLRSAQNAGTGSTAYSLGGLGTYNGTLVNGPTWGADGITITSTANITDTLGAPTFPASLVVAGRRVAGTGDASWDYLSATSSRQLAKRMYVNNSAGLAITGVGYIMLVDTNAQTLTDDFEVVTGVVPSATNSAAQFFVNTLSEPAQHRLAQRTQGAPEPIVLEVTIASQHQHEPLRGNPALAVIYHRSQRSILQHCAPLYRKSTLGQGLGLP
jgi:hypothetical protein